jgi:hypothetical protein
MGQSFPMWGAGGERNLSDLEFGAQPYRQLGSYRGATIRTKVDRSGSMPSLAGGGRGGSSRVTPRPVGMPRGAPL